MGIHVDPKVDRTEGPKGKVINVSFKYKCRSTSVPPGSLLPPMRDPNTVGKIKVRLTNSFLSNMFGTFGYTDFVETRPGYVHIYLPKVGFTDISKALIVEVDDEANT